LPGGEKHMERRLLNDDEISSMIKGLKGWRAKEGKLKREFEFANFAESLAFVNRVGEVAESMDHHPDIEFGWGYAKISTTTHDRGGITDVDLALANKIDGIVALKS
jgi:4a-hydroxytetrahydrobiopterin dehydratase